MENGKKIADIKESKCLTTDGDHSKEKIDQVGKHQRRIYYMVQHQTEKLKENKFPYKGST